MKNWWVIYKLTLRASLRERVAWSMLALVAGVLILLPLGLRGDGTLSGELRMHIRYSIGLSAGLLAAMTLWVSCASVAGDLSSKRLHMVLTKPVSRAAVWWGKWLAVSTLSVSLLFLCGFVTLFRVNGVVRSAAAEKTPAEMRTIRETVLTARKPEAPVPEDLTDEIEARLREELRTAVLPPGVTEDMLRREIELLLLALRNSARQGQTVRWEYELSAPVRAEEDLQLAYRFDGASMGAVRVPGEWRVGTPEQPDLFTRQVEQSPAGEYVLHLNEDGQFDGAARIVVSFVNQSESGDMVFFRPGDGVMLYRPGGAFAPNFLRALGLLSGLLALLAALGVSSGGLFSLPVACYVTSVMLVMRGFARTVELALEEGTPLSRMEDPGFVVRTLNSVSMFMYRGIHMVLRPLDLDSPLERVANGVLISAGELTGVLFLRMLPVLLLIAGGGIFLFHKREAGVAE
ncbi:MAG: ABC transporter permease [Kiritimatiellae bacterium]|nr:ABC transporter permease [Kiritimatiellia bacterium]